MNEIICVDGNFTPEALKFYNEFGVVPPEQDKIYNIRAVILNSNGKKGLLLEELVNPHVPFISPALGQVMNEPNWDINRFRTLNGEIVKNNSKTITKCLKKVIK